MSFPTREYTYSNIYMCVFVVTFYGGVIVANVMVNSYLRPPGFLND